MGLIIWYKVTFPGVLGGLDVSNDVFSGDYIVDANIKITMTAGPSADTFGLTLNNLPAHVAKALKAKMAQGLADGVPLLVEIYLGYFDDPTTRLSPVAVLEGAVTLLKTTVSDSGILITELKGEEIGGYRLRTHCIHEFKPGEVRAFEYVEAVKQATKVDIASGAVLSLLLTDFTLKAKNGLAALGEIADKAEAPLIVRDNKIHIGPLVGSEPAPVLFSPQTNIVQLDPALWSEELHAPGRRCQEGRVPSQARTGLTMTVLGHPGLRVGQMVVIAAEDVPLGVLRINHLVHDFSTQTGYTCQATVVSAAPGERANGASGAHGVVNRFRELAENSQDRRPAIDVGQVVEYKGGDQGKHLLTLDYGQSPPAASVAPSVETQVDQDVRLQNKPIASPFAWHRCGLVVPIYPGMRALLAHNRGLVNDAVVNGFLWSENPRYEPPKNEAGDYWLCLPTELDSEGQPTGKGVNDLTDRAGMRVIQAKGLHILVGADKLPALGERPEVAKDLENTIVIEHQSGTQITIDGHGALTIKTDNQDISLTNGGVTLALSGSAVNVS